MGCHVSVLMPAYNEADNLVEVIPATVAALEELLVRVGRLVEDVPEIAELDLNPVRVYAAGQGACALDARVRVGEVGGG